MSVTPPIIDYAAPRRIMHKRGMSTSQLVAELVSALLLMGVGLINIVIGVVYLMRPHEARGSVATSVLAVLMTMGVGFFIVGWMAVMMWLAINEYRGKNS